VIRERGGPGGKAGVSASASGDAAGAAGVPSTQFDGSALYVCALASLMFGRCDPREVLRILSGLLMRASPN